MPNETAMQSNSYYENTVLNTFSSYIFLLQIGWINIEVSDIIMLVFCLYLLCSWLYTARLNIQLVVHTVIAKPIACWLVCFVAHSQLVSF